jgi:hypothetical protein
MKSRMTPFVWLLLLTVIIGFGQMVSLAVKSIH